MAKKKPEPDAAQKLANEIAASLLTMQDGSNDRADHLVLYQDRRRLGGWAEDAMADEIARHLRQAQTGANGGE